MKPPLWCPALLLGKCLKCLRIRELRISGEYKQLPFYHRTRFQVPIFLNSLFLVSYWWMWSLNRTPVPAGLGHFCKNTTLSAAISSPNPIHPSHLEQMRQVIKRGGAGVFMWGHIELSEPPWEHFFPPHTTHPLCLLWWFIASKV